MIFLSAAHGVMGDEASIQRRPERTARRARQASRPGAVARPHPEAILQDRVRRAARQDPFAVLLDGRAIRTPGKARAGSAGRAAGTRGRRRMGSAGRAYRARHDAADQLANSAIDAVEERWDEVAADIVAFAGSDLLCYRAETPDTPRSPAGGGLESDPRLGETRARRRFRTPRRRDAHRAAAGDVATPSARARGIDALSLAALHVLTTISGSAVLAIAHWKGHLSARRRMGRRHGRRDLAARAMGPRRGSRSGKAAQAAEFEAASRCLRSSSFVSDEDVLVGALVRAAWSRTTNLRIAEREHRGEQRQQIVPGPDGDAERTRHPHAGPRREPVDARAAPWMMVPAARNATPAVTASMMRIGICTSVRAGWC